ncbi:MAG: glycoside hydrolase family 38 C-terminal domain-containing protein [Verrucomicrobiota bacterium]
MKLAPLSGAPVADLPAVTVEQPVHASARKLESAQVKAAFDAKGRIASLAFGGLEIATEGPLADLVLFPDYPHEFEAWELDRQTLSLGRSVDTPAEAAVLVAGGVVAGGSQGTVEFRRKLGTASTVAVRYRIDAFQPVLHVEYEIDWHEPMTLLKTVFPTAYRGRSARFGAPFGSVLRGQLAGPSRDEAMFEGAGSRWAIVSDDGESAGWP